MIRPPPDLCSKPSLEVADLGVEGIGEVLPGLPRAPPDPFHPEIYPGNGVDVGGVS